MKDVSNMADKIIFPIVGSFLKLNSENKVELHIPGKDSYKQLNESVKADIKSSFLWSNSKKCWVSRHANGRLSFRMDKYLIPYQGKDELSNLTPEEKLEHEKNRKIHKAEKLVKWADSADKKAEALKADFNRFRKDWSWLTQPFVNTSGGRAFANHKTRVLNRYDKGIEMTIHADKMRKSAELLLSAADHNQLNDRNFLLRKVKELTKYMKNNIDEYEKLANADLSAFPDDKLLKIDAFFNRFKNNTNLLAFFQSKLEEKDKQNQDSGKLNMHQMADIVSKHFKKFMAGLGYEITNLRRTVYAEHISFFFRCKTELPDIFTGFYASKNIGTGYQNEVLAFMLKNGFVIPNDEKHKALKETELTIEQKIDFCIKNIPVYFKNKHGIVVEVIYLENFNSFNVYSASPLPYPWSVYHQKGKNPSEMYDFLLENASFLNSAPEKTKETSKRKASIKKDRLAKKQTNSEIKIMKLTNPVKSTPEPLVKKKKGRKLDIETNMYAPQNFVLLRKKDLVKRRRASREIDILNKKETKIGVRNSLKTDFEFPLAFLDGYFEFENPIENQKNLINRYFVRFYKTAFKDDAVLINAYNDYFKLATKNLIHPFLSQNKSVKEVKVHVTDLYDFMRKFYNIYRKAYAAIPRSLDFEITEPLKNIPLAPQKPNESDVIEYIRKYFSSILFAKFGIRSNIHINTNNEPPFVAITSNAFLPYELTGNLNPSHRVRLFVNVVYNFLHLLHGEVKQPITSTNNKKEEESLAPTKPQNDLILNPTSYNSGKKNTVTIKTSGTGKPKPVNKTTNSSTGDYGNLSNSGMIEHVKNHFESFMLKMFGITCKVYFNESTGMFSINSKSQLPAKLANIQQHTPKSLYQFIITNTGSSNNLFTESASKYLH